MMGILLSLAIFAIIVALVWYVVSNVIEFEMEEEEREYRRSLEGMEEKS